MFAIRRFCYIEVLFHIFYCSCGKKIVPCILDLPEKLACENICFSSLFAAGDVSRGATSATQRQKFHTDDVNQCLHYKSGSHGVPNTNLSNFTYFLVDFGKVLCSSANELEQSQMLLVEKTIFHKY